MTQTVKQKRLVVLGGGESGVGAAILAKVKGMDVFLSDMGKIAPRYADMLREHDIPFEQGTHTPQLILNADEVVKSPGSPPTARMVPAFAPLNYPIKEKSTFAGR
ncbi:MAG: UDP-N-acetylmuramoyl-L-alanine--D-glutamate ligase, partial [Muribaculaceae bacterium]|nr:UDP-N-acetylmuramoyl-L-alanine--D-glutamate ligase [Muribaculaceae bacterium]